MEPLINIFGEASACREAIMQGIRKSALTEDMD